MLKLGKMYGNMLIVAGVTCHGTKLSTETGTTMVYIGSIIKPGTTLEIILLQE